MIDSQGDSDTKLNEPIVSKEESLATLLEAYERIKQIRPDNTIAKNTRFLSMMIKKIRLNSKIKKIVQTRNKQPLFDQDSKYGDAELADEKSAMSELITWLIERQEIPFGENVLAPGQPADSTEMELSILRTNWRNSIKSEYSNTGMYSASFDGKKQSLLTDLDLLFGANLCDLFLKADKSVTRVLLNYEKLLASYFMYSEDAAAFAPTKLEPLTERIIHDYIFLPDSDIHYLKFDSTMQREGDTKPFDKAREAIKSAFSRRSKAQNMSHNKLSMVYKKGTFAAVYPELEQLDEVDQHITFLRGLSTSTPEIGFVTLQNTKFFVLMAKDARSTAKRYAERMLNHTRQILWFSEVAILEVKLEPVVSGIYKGTRYAAVQNDKSHKVRLNTIAGAVIKCLKSEREYDIPLRSDIKKDLERVSLVWVADGQNMKVVKQEPMPSSQKRDELLLEERAQSIYRENIAIGKMIGYFGIVKFKHEYGLAMTDTHDVSAFFNTKIEPFSNMYPNGERFDQMQGHVRDIFACLLREYSKSKMIYYEQLNRIRIHGKTYRDSIGESNKNSAIERVNAIYKIVLTVSNCFEICTMKTLELVNDINFCLDSRIPYIYYRGLEGIIADENEDLCINPPDMIRENELGGLDDYNEHLFNVLMTGAKDEGAEEPVKIWDIGIIFDETYVELAVKAHIENLRNHVHEGEREIHVGDVERQADQALPSEEIPGQIQPSQIIPEHIQNTDQLAEEPQQNAEQADLVVGHPGTSPKPIKKRARSSNRKRHPRKRKVAIKNTIPNHFATSNSAALVPQNSQESDPPKRTKIKPEKLKAQPEEKTVIEDEMEKPEQKDDVKCISRRSREALILVKAVARIT